MLDLMKLRNKKTGKVHASETGIKPSCRDIKNEHILLFEETEHGKVNCKYCLKLLRNLFLDEERKEEAEGIVRQTFFPYDDNHKLTKIA